MVQRGLVEIAPPASSAAVPGAAGLTTSARPSATGPLPMTGITPWASGSAGRLLFLEALTLSSRFGETAREAVFLIAQINSRMSAYGP
jgi:hypothetical protein